MARPSARNLQVIRQWLVLLALQARPCTIATLATEGNVTTRTVRRDLEALQTAGFPLYNERGDDGAMRWHLLPTASVPVRRAA